MVRYLVLLNFTEQGLKNIKESPDRAAAFQEEANSAGVTVEGIFWTLGSHDGALIITASDEEAATAQILKLGSRLNVTTKMLRAFDAEGFRAVLSKF